MFMLCTAYLFKSSCKSSKTDLKRSRQDSIRSLGPWLFGALLPGLILGNGVSFCRELPDADCQPFRPWISHARSETLPFTLPACRADSKFDDCHPWIAWPHGARVRSRIGKTTRKLKCFALDIIFTLRSDQHIQHERPVLNDYAKNTKCSSLLRAEKTAWAWVDFVDVVISTNCSNL